MEHRLYPALFGVAMLAMVGLFTLFPQLKPDGVNVQWGKGPFPTNGRGVPTRSASWSTAAPTKAEGHFDRGTLSLEREEWDLAIQEFDEVLRLEPKNADAFYNRGFAKLAKDQYDAALADFDAVVRLRPRDVDALLARAAVRVEQNLPNLAISDLDAALGIDPDDVEAYCERGKIREEAGEYRLALYDYQLALQRASDDPLVLNYLAWLLSTAPEPALRDGRRAVEMAARAVNLENSREWDTIDTLAAAFAELGKFPEAVRAEEEALRLAPAEGQGDLKLPLELYRAKKAYRLGGR